MSTLVQWVHVSAAVIGVGGMAFMLLVLFPSAGLLEEEQRERLLKASLGRFRWVSWSVIVLLLASGLYNVKLVWLVPWGTLLDVPYHQDCSRTRRLRHHPVSHHSVENLQRVQRAEEAVALHRLRPGHACDPDFRLPAPGVMPAGVSVLECLVLHGAQLCATHSMLG